jgi:hypothetical protein
MIGAVAKAAAPCRIHARGADVARTPRPAWLGSGHGPVARRRVTNLGIEPVVGAMTSTRVR